ncbi:helicase, putative, RecD/TraA family [butyrate-producing bacterium SM4/1]|nr:helicase, putative, RecD/TraA family [butyrate-producing bacterium SM4/1]
MICTFEHQLYKNEGNGYTVARYMVRSAASGRSNMSSVFIAVGKELPCIANAEIGMEGKWVESPKWGPQFRVSWFRSILPKTEDGIISYLSSDLMKGIGPVTARAIVQRFGVQTFDVLDKEPEKLLDIRGITQQKLSVILESYRQSEGIRELLACLAPFQVTPKKAEKIQAHFGANAAAIVRENPYRLCEVKGFGFLTVDPIARASRQFKPNDQARIRAAIRYILREGEKEGNLFLPGSAIVEQAYPLLNQGFSEDSVTRPEIMRIGNEMAREKIELAADGANVFLKENRQEELYAAYHLVRLLKAETAKPDIEQPLEEAQAAFGIILSERQKDAVRMVFQSNVSVITGGPGKGKTTVLRVVLEVFKRITGREDFLLCAPTGRARKRLSESAGAPALTLHKAMYLNGEEDLSDLADSEDLLEEELIIADEFTMSDMWLSSILFSRVRSGARLVLVGDVDQLPSVGPGAVFKAIIDSGIVPVTVLDVFFRQAKDSRIILNADRMIRSQRTLIYGDDFQFHPAEDDHEAAKIIASLYQAELVRAEGNPDMVQVLSPYRVKTEAGVNALNRMLREIANPASADTAQWNVGGQTFRIQDKVMQTRNVDNISNGDIGRVVQISRRKDGNRQLQVDFGEEKRMYQEEDLEDLEFAYATSVHKSQGAEYPVVILPVLKCFYPMLRRDIYYTGITRAKARVHLVGSKSALAIAISRTNIGTRNTMLAERIQAEAKRQGYIPEWKAA